LEQLESRFALSTTPLITEFMASNDSTLADGDGNYSDWIEIYNPTSTTIDLAGWHLTDDSNNLDKWTFPSRPQSVLDPGEYLVVFASGQPTEAYVDSSGALHTDFALSAEGEYFALTDPSEMVIHEFAPSFPAQTPDASYGIVQESSTLVASDAPTTVHIPTNGSLGLSWTTAAFDDSSWISGTSGVGYEQGGGAITATAYGTFVGAVGSQQYGGSLGMDFDVNFPITVSQLGVFDSGSNGLSRTITSQIWSRNGNSGSLLASLTFTPGNPGTLVGGDRFKPLGSPLILPPGSYTVVAYGYGVGEPNGNAAEGGPLDSQKTLNDGGGRISFVGSSRYGNAGSFPSTQDSVGANRYSAGTFQYQISAYDEYIATDVETFMRNVNASAYARYEFSLADPNLFTALTLNAQYNDGFAAYLNGTLVATRNSPGSLTWNSAATTERTALQSTTPESINLTAHLGLLNAGNNVLAIHALNNSVNDGAFLILPQLTANQALGIPEHKYFDNPTPGSPNDANSTFDGFVDEVTASVKRGFFTSPFNLTLSSTPGATIRYTTNGIPPTSTTGTVYTGSIPINSTTTLTAVAFKNGLRDSAAVTNTYLFLDDVVLQSGTPTDYPSDWNGYAADYDISQSSSHLPLIAGNPGLTVPQARDAIKNSLLSIPTLSIVIPEDDLFDSSTGIYANPAARGDNWERAASIEYILPDGSEGFQINGGLQIMGFTSRNLGFNPKLSMRVVFKNEYGPSRLNYPFFENTSVDSFNTIALRANARDNWSFSGSRAGATYLKDEFAKLTQADMGALATSGKFVHLYINGIYWGLYNPTERPDGDFATDYLGSSSAGYDAVKFCAPEEAVDGDTIKWDELRTLARAGLGSDAAYQFIQGNNPDGTRNPAYQVLLDVDSFIDFIINGQYIGSEDWPGNYYAIRDRGPDSKGFQFFTWDNDLAFTSNKVQTDPGHTWWMQSPGEIDIAIRANPEYRLRFADRVHELYFNDGALTPTASIARWNGLADGVREALIAESARWGDTYGSLYTPNNQWETAISSVANYLATRSDDVLNDLRAHGLYPNVEAPTFNQQGGQVTHGFDLTISAPGSSIFYTLDGSDPRDPGGWISTSAIQYSVSPIDITEGVTIRARAVSGGQWSAVNNATFTINTLADVTNLRLTELHYHPAAPSTAEINAGFTDEDEFEFIELHNISNEPIELKNVTASGGIDLTFTNSTVLAPGERVVLVENQPAFEFRYGLMPRIVGKWSGKLANNGEMITLSDAGGQIIHQFTFLDGNDPGEEEWPTEPDGNGPSLVVIDTEGNYNDGTNWKASNVVNGTPGSDEPAPILGDFNLDGYVDNVDLDLWKSGYGTLYGGRDFLNWQRNFTGPPQLAAITTETVEPQLTSGRKLPASGWSLSYVSAIGYTERSQATEFSVADLMRLPDVNRESNEVAADFAFEAIYRKPAFGSHEVPAGLLAPSNKTQQEKANALTDEGLDQFLFEEINASII
jgi:hypothetical protein